MFSWNRPEPSATAGRRPPGILRPSGTVWLDRSGGMALAGGRFVADRSLAERITGELRDTNQLSLVLQFTPASVDQSGAIVALSDGGRRRNFTLRQQGRTIEARPADLRLRPRGSAIAVAELTAAAPTTLGLRFTPGRLTIFRDGAAGETVPFPGDFFPWRPAEFAIGTESGSRESFRGTVAQLSLWNRALGDAELAGSLTRIRQASGNSTVRRLDAEVRVLETTPAPELAAIAPYREALVVDRVEVVRVLSGSPPAERILRRVRWAILDGHALPVPRRGDLERVVLEPFAAQPQLEPFYLGDSTGAESAPLWFDLDGSVAP
ncbi:MAG: LamG-like jellyroll fold domain-containing protein [Thermoanaerobaculia bacterium]